MNRALQKMLMLGLVLCVFVALPLLALSGLYSIKFGHCKIFPNGIEIGYEAYVHFGEPYFSPDPVLREPNGKIIGKEIFPLHITDKAAFGISRPKFGTELPYHERRAAQFAFIWTQETGVVRSDQKPELYQSLKQDLGAVFYGAAKDKRTNTRWFLNFLDDGGQFDGETCHTSLMTW